MELLVVYAKIKNEVKLIGIHSSFYYLESRYDFSPKKRSENMLTVENYKNYVDSSLYVDANTFTTRISTTLDEESFMKMFSEKLLRSLNEYGDEKVIVALSIN